MDDQRQATQEVNIMVLHLRPNVVGEQPSTASREGQNMPHSPKTRQMPTGTFAVPVALFGCGMWGQKQWLPVLVQLARWGVIHLTVVDRGDVAPAALAALAQEGVLEYRSWGAFEAAVVPDVWQIAFVVTSATAHLPVIRRLVERVPSLQVVVCEKPCGESYSQMAAAAAVCQHAGVRLLVTDHYLLRPPVQYLLKYPQILRRIGEVVRITVAMNETAHTGPAQGVVADMAVHLLNVLCTLFPGAKFVPETAFTAQALHHPHTDEETYCFSVGQLHIPGFSPVPCTLECGKQLESNYKALIIVGTHGRMHLNLIANTLTLSLNHAPEEVFQWNPDWFYARLICLTLATLSTLPLAPSPQR
jgi:predicted dehydrogenase